MDQEIKSDGSWWRTVPGILTAAAATITAVTGLIVALQQSGWIGSGNPSPQHEKVASAGPVSALAPTAAPAAATRAVTQSPAQSNPAAAPRPWSESEAVITSTEGLVTVVNAESLSNCISTGKDLTLSSGQSIVFEKMRSFEFMRDNVRPTVVITLLNGKTVQGTMSMGCDIAGTNDLGRFSLPFEKVKRVEFKR